MDSMNCTLLGHIWLWYENKLILTTAWGRWIKFCLVFTVGFFSSFCPSTVVTGFSVVSEDIFRNCSNRMYVIYWQNSFHQPASHFWFQIKWTQPRSGMHSPWMTVDHLFQKWWIDKTMLCMWEMKPHSTPAFLDALRASFFHLPSRLMSSCPLS